MSGEIFALLAAISWMITAIAFENAGKYVSINIVNFLKLFFAFIFITIIVYIYFDKNVVINLRDSGLKYLLISGFIGFVIGDFFLVHAFVILGSRISLLIMSSAPPIGAILGFFIFGEKISLIGISGMAMTLAGIIIVLLEKNKDSEDILKVKHPIKGILFAFLGAVCQAVGLIFSKLGMEKFNVLVATQLRIVAGLVGLIIIITLNKKWNDVRKAFENFQVIGNILIGAFFGLTLGIIFSLLAISKTSVGIASTLMAVAPVLILPISIFYFKEKVDIKGIFGAIIAVLGIGVLVFY